MTLNAYKVLSIYRTFGILKSMFQEKPLSTLEKYTFLGVFFSASYSHLKLSVRFGSANCRAGLC